MFVATDPNAALDDLADRFWQGLLERDPMWATILGDTRYDDRWPDLGASGRADEEAAYRAALAEARDIPSDGLDPERVITRDLLVLISENHLEVLRQKQYQLAVDHIAGPQVWPAEIAQYQRADTPEQLERLLDRWGAYPAMIEDHVAALTEGVADGRTAAAVPVRRAIEQIDRLLAMTPDAHPATSMVHVADDDARERVRVAVEEHVYGGLRRLRTFLADEYEPHARSEPGLSTTPGGEEAYRLAIRVQTSLDTTAEEVHAFGLADLEGIEAEKDEIARRLGHADRHALRQALLDDPTNRTVYLSVLLHDDVAGSTTVFGEVIVVFLRYAFSVLDLRKVYAETTGFSLAGAQEIVDRFDSLREEGRLADHHYLGGRFWDLIVLAIYADQFSKDPLVNELLTYADATSVPRGTPGAPSFADMCAVLARELDRAEIIGAAGGTLLVEDLRLDSLGIVEAVAVLEDNFGFAGALSLTQLRTLQDLFSMIC